MSRWDDDLTNRLIELWTNGTSTKQIITELNVTKGALLSKVKRLKLNRPIAYQVENKGLKSLLHLKNHQCHWPVNFVDDNHLFCGRRVVKGKPYCDEHYNKSINHKAMKLYSNKDLNSWIT